MNRIFKILDRFIYSKDKESPDSLYRSRFFIAIQFLLLLLNLIGTPYYLSYALTISWVIVVATVVVIVVLSSVFFIYPRYGYRIVFVNTLAVLATIPSFYGTCFSTGGIFSPDLALYPVITIFIFLTANRTSGFIWAGINLAQIIFLFVAERVQMHSFRLDELKLTSDYFLFSLVFPLIFAVVLVVAYEQLQKHLLKLVEDSNLKLEKSKKELEEKNLSVTQSIQYAKQIQTAVLPHEETIQRNIPLSFILYSPKDIVSGDFYWFHEIDANSYIFVCADCTGHGVPGALMTVIGSSYLNQIIVEGKNFTPKLILEELDSGISNILKQKKVKDSSVADGIDLSIIKVDKTKKEIIFAGAKRGIMLIQNNELKEIKGDKLSIGGNIYDTSRKVFNETLISFNEDDMLYLFTDGYIDQFGGKENKKFMIKQLKELLLNINKLKMNDQKTHLENALKSWMGNHEQTDDITVVGIRF